MGRPKKSIDPGIILDNDIIVYKTKLQSLAAEYIEKYLDNDSSMISSHMRHCILFISENVKIEKDKLSDIEYCLSLYRAYEDLMDIYNYNPSFGMYCKAYNISINELKTGLNNKYSYLFEYIQNSCKTRIIDYLSNNSGSSRNIQFIASSVYGMSEIVPKRGSESQFALTNKELAAQIGVID